MSDTSMRMNRETKKKVIAVRAKIEYTTGKKTTLEQAIQKACDYFVSNWKGETK
jgi:hypothetical protein